MTDANTDQKTRDARLRSRPSDEEIRLECLKMANAHRTHGMNMPQIRHNAADYERWIHDGFQSPPDVAADKAAAAPAKKSGK